MTEVSKRLACRWPRLILLLFLVRCATALPAPAEVITPPPGEDTVKFNGLGPPLDALASKVADPNWVVAWLMKPSRLRPGTMMPDPDLSAQEAQAVAKFLYGSPPVAKPSTLWQGGTPRTGEKLFVSRGCRGCHGITADEPSISPRVPNLAGVGLKLNGGWLFNWLKSPRAYNPRTAMPQLALSDDDIRHLIAFLLTCKQGGEALAAAPRFDPAADAAAGRKVLQEYECFKCHQLKGFDPPAPAFDLVADDAREAALHNGRLIIAYYNCRGCHFVEGSGAKIRQYLERKSFAPPTLEGEGARVQTSWLIDFLQHPTNLRPWLEMRMPIYGFSATEAAAVANYFAARAGVAAADESYQPASQDLFTHGLRRFAHFQCVQCHPTNADRVLPADIDPENLSINLTLAKARLRPSWIRQFLVGPKAILGTQTRMPDVFFTIDGVPKVEHPEKDIEAITAYLMQMTEPPETTLAKRDAERKREQEAQPDWTTYQY